MPKAKILQQLRTQRLKLKGYLILLVLAATLPLGVFAGVLVWRDVRVHRAAVDRGLRDTARALSIAVDREVRAARAVLETLAASNYLDTEDFKPFHELCADAASLQPKGSRIVLFDRSGQQLVNTGRRFGERLPNLFLQAQAPGGDPRYPVLAFGGAEPVREVFSSARPAVSDMFVAISTQEPTLTIGVPVIRRGKVLYVLEMALSPRMLSGLLAEQQLPADWIATIIDRRGVVIGRNTAPEAAVGRPSKLGVPQGLEEGFGRGVRIEGAPLYYAFSRSKLTGWTTAVGLPAAVLDETAGRSIRLLAGGGLILLLVGLIAALRFSQRISRPIAELAQSADSLQRGEPVLLRSSAVYEIGLLQESLLRAGAAARSAESERERRVVAEARQKEAEAAREKVTNILESMSDSFCALDREWRFAYFNGKAESDLARLNLKASDLLGKVLWEVFPEQVGTRWYRSLKRAMEERVPVACEFYFSPLGEWYDDHISPTPDGGIGIYRRDMTEHKRAERRLAANLAVTRILAESPELGAAAPRILKTICETLGWEVGALWVPDADGTRLSCLTVWNDPSAGGIDEFLGACRECTFPPGVGLPGRIWTSAQPAWIPDVTRDGNFPRAPVAVKAGLHAGFGFPILFGGKLLGVMEFFSREIREPDDALIAMFGSIGGQIGQFMERKRAEQKLAHALRQQGALYRFVEQRSRAESSQEIYRAALEAILAAVCCDRAAILVRDDSGFMRFAAWRGLSEEYRKSVEGHSPWKADDPDPRPVPIADVAAADLDGAVKAAVLREGIGALAFIPLVANGRLAGKLMTYYNAPHVFDAEEIELSMTIARQLSFGLERRRADEALRESEARFRTIADSAPVLMWLNDADGCIFVNRAYLDYLGLCDAAEVGGYGWTRYVHPEDRDRYTEAYRECLERRAPFAAECRFRRHDGEYRWMHSVAMPRFTAAGEFLGYSGCSYDVHDARVATEALREADRRKDEFLAMLGHELRNPLAVINTAVQVLQLKAAEESKRRELYGIIERQVDHMKRLLDDLLDVARITRGQIRLKKEPCDLAQIVRETAADLGEFFAQSRLRLVVDVPERPVRLVGDSARLAQVVGNLLHNAGKFTDAGGSVAVRLEERAGVARLTVRDTGVGMEREFLDRVFEPFSQADRSMDRSRGGLGLGLALVKGLIELHGGKVQAESAGPGRGAEISVELPIGAALARRDLVAAAAGASRPWRILIIEDNSVAAKSTEMLLETLGHTVEVAHNGKDGVEAARRFRPEVVLCDIGLPEMNGYAVAQALRQEAGLNAYLIALSGYGQDEYQRRAREAGFDAYVTKPINFDDLEKMLAAVTPSSAP
ncbi:MAG TPA: GAF domain-containing protein [Candidatus Acidoferrales bacterium]|nr:GAF domain-containing protein [Candidatus Acidoferrales bacterium]